MTDPRPTRETGRGPAPAGPIWYLAGRLSIDPWDAQHVYRATKSGALQVRITSQHLRRYNGVQQRRVVCLLLLIGRQIGYRPDEVTPLGLVLDAWKAAGLPPAVYRRRFLPEDVQVFDADALGVRLRLREPRDPGQAGTPLDDEGDRAGPVSIAQWRRAVETASTLVRNGS